MVESEFIRDFEKEKKTEKKKKPAKKKVVKNKVVKKSIKKRDIRKLIPEKIRGFNFVLIGKYVERILTEGDGKQPAERGWQKKVHRFEDFAVQEHLKQGRNYGIQPNNSSITFEGDTEAKFLVMIDFDTKEFQDKVLDKFPKTFTTTSGSKKNCVHLWLASDNNKAFKIKNENLDTLADFIGSGNQIIGVGSKHNSGSVYSIVEDEPLAFMPYSEIEALLKPHDKSPKKVKKPKKQFVPKNIEGDLVEEIYNSVSMEDVLSTIGIDTSKNPTGCFLHGSNGGKCFSYDDETAHCFHCDGGWNKYSLIREAKNFSDKETFDWFAKTTGRMDELKEDRKKFKKEKDQEIEKMFIASGENLREEVLTFLALKKTREATQLIVNSFLKDNFVYSTRDDKKSEMWIYENGIYVPHGISYIDEFCESVLGRVFTRQLANEVIEKIKVKTYIDQDKFFGVNYVDEIPINHGILNLKTREVKPFDPKKIFFSKLPLNYNSKAKCEKIEIFFKDILKEEEDVKVMFEIFGFLLLKEYRIEKAIMFNGSGRNGKGKTLSLMEKFVGSNNVCNVPLTSMQKDNFDLEDLFGKLINVGGDTGKTSLKDTGCFKELTGRDGVNLKRKFKRTLRFVNYAKHIFACNDLPIVYDNTEGFWSRWILIDFPFKFKTKKEIEIEENKENLKVIDTNILNKISTQEELDGLLISALNGLDRILKQNDFSFSKGVEYTQKTWKRRANSFLAFCQDCIEEDENSSIVKIKIKKVYSNYCKKYNLKARASDKVIKSTLENEYFAEETRDQDRKRMWEGIKFKDLPSIPTINHPIGENKVLVSSSNTMGKVGKQQISKEKPLTNSSFKDLVEENKDLGGEITKDEIDFSKSNILEDKNE